MLDLTRKITDELIIGDHTYQMNLSFDVVLKIIELVNDQSVPNTVKAFIALKMLTDKDLTSVLTLEESFEVFELVFNEHIKLVEEEQVVDLKGNIIPIKTTQSKIKPKLYSLKHDAEYIYASFMQAYGIDLFEEQGKLHWKKFNALFNGLPSNTKMVEVINIRAWKPSKGESTKYKEHMRSLQKEYELPEDS